MSNYSCATCPQMLYCRLRFSLSGCSLTDFGGNRPNEFDDTSSSVPSLFFDKKLEDHGCADIVVEDYEKELKVLEIIKEKGLSLLHKSLIISSKNYKEYREEFKLVKSREFKNEHFYSQQEFVLLKEVLLK